MATKQPGTPQERRGNGAGKGNDGVRARNATPEDEEFIEEHAQGLSRSTQRAKWMHSPDEHEDRPGQTLATRHHDVIRRWAEERGAKPATVPGSEHNGRPGVLRFDFPGYGGQSLKETSWDEWFRTFDERHLVFLFQEHKADGKLSNFFQLDNPEREDG